MYKRVTQTRVLHSPFNIPHIQAFQYTVVPNNHFSAFLYHYCIISVNRYLCVWIPGSGQDIWGNLLFYYIDRETFWAYFLSMILTGNDLCAHVCTCTHASKINTQITGRLHLLQPWRDGDIPLYEIIWWAAKGIGLFKSLQYCQDWFPLLLFLMTIVLHHCNDL